MLDADQKKQQMANLMANLEDMKKVTTKQQMEEKIIAFLKNYNSPESLGIQKDIASMILYTMSELLKNIISMSDNAINTILSDKNILSTLNETYLNQHFELTEKIRQGTSKESINIKFPPDQLLVARYFGAMNDLQKSIPTLSAPKKIQIEEYDDEGLGMDDLSSKLKTRTISSHDEMSEEIDWPEDDDNNENELDSNITAQNSSMPMSNTPSGSPSTTSMDDSDDEDMSAFYDDEPQQPLPQQTIRVRAPSITHQQKSSSSPLSEVKTKFNLSVPLQEERDKSQSPGKK